MRHAVSARHESQALSHRCGIRCQVGGQSLRRLFQGVRSHARRLAVAGQDDRLKTARASTLAQKGNRFSEKGNRNGSSLSARRSMITGNQSNPGSCSPQVGCPVCPAGNCHDIIAPGRWLAGDGRTVTVLCVRLSKTTQAGWPDGRTWLGAGRHPLRKAGAHAKEDCVLSGAGCGSSVPASCKGIEPVAHCKRSRHRTEGLRPDEFPGCRRSRTTTSKPNQP